MGAGFTAVKATGPLNLPAGPLPLALLAKYDWATAD